jgi:tetratricopeptide (TPR) repeat protein
VKALRRAVALAPGDAVAWTNLGIALERTGAAAEAESSRGRALELAPELAQARDNRGLLLKQQGRLDEAASQLRRAVAAEPGYAKAQEELGLTLHATGDHAAALGPLRAALERPVAALALGRSLQECGALDDALADYREVLRRNPALYAAVVGNLTSAASGRLWLRPADLRRALFDDPG